MMPRWAIYACLALGIFALGLGTGLGISARRASAKATAAQSQSDQHEGAAQVHAAQAAEFTKQAAANAPRIAGADAARAAAKAKLAQIQALPIIPSAPGPDYKTLYEQALVVIAADDESLKAQKLQTSIEMARADQLQAALDESQKALALKGIAMDAAVRSERASGIKSQLIHVGEAAAAAYLMGRAH